MFDAFRRDERAIEGLPIRLVIALVVGVASLSIMMSMLSGVEGLSVSEVDVEPDPEVVNEGSHDVALEVVDSKGKPVSNATVVARGDTARLGNTTTAKTGADGTANVTIHPTLGPNQEDGTVTFKVKPPSGGGYQDERDNTELLVIQQ